MAEMTIRLRTDPTTGKKDIIIDLKSDDDSMPHEHERQHRALVQRLVEGGLVKAEEVGKVIIERERAATEPVLPQSIDPSQQRGSEAAGSH